MQATLIDGAFPEHDKRVVALVRKAQHSVCVFADDTLSAFTLIGSDDFIVPAGLRCVGAVGFVDGVPKAALREDLDDAALGVLTTACVSQLVSVLERCAGLPAAPTRSDA